MENSRKIDEDKLELIAKELDVSVEAIKNFSEEGMVNYFNSFKDAHNSQVNLGTNTASFNSLDKLIEVYAEKQDLYEENQKLHERLLESEKEKIAYLERLLKDK